MIFSPDLLPKVLDGTKTQTRRPARDGSTQLKQFQAGKTLAVQPGRGQKSVARIRLLSCSLTSLGGISESDARAEGFAGAVEFRHKWVEIYGSFSLALLVWRLEFELVKS